jgi:dCMP deaminase
MKDFVRKDILLDYVGTPDDFRDVLATRPSWDEYFMILAKVAATRSTCISRPTGALIVRNKQVLSTGYNGSMPGIAHCSDEGACFRRSSGASDAGKYDNCRSVHAEANAIAQAAKNGVNIEGASVYVTLYPCYVCTKLLVQAGIKKVYYEFEYKSVDVKRDKLWAEALKQAGLKIQKIELSDIVLQKTLVSLLGATSWRRELTENGEPTGRIENINMEEMHK